VSHEAMPAWAQAMIDLLADRHDTMQGALTEAISDLRREMATRFDKVDQTLTARAEGEQVNTMMLNRAERHAKQAAEDSHDLAAALVSQQQLIQRLEARVTALEDRAA
jgi:gamma-glutamylcysteine synthetase